MLPRVSKTIKKERRKGRDDREMTSMGGSGGESALDTADEAGSAAPSHSGAADKQGGENQGKSTGGWLSRLSPWKKEAEGKTVSQGRAEMTSAGSAEDANDESKQTAESFHRPQSASTDVLRKSTPEKEGERVRDGPAAAAQQAASRSRSAAAAPDASNESLEREELQPFPKLPGLDSVLDDEESTGTARNKEMNDANDNKNQNKAAGDSGESTVVEAFTQDSGQSAAQRLPANKAIKRFQSDSGLMMEPTKPLRRNLSFVKRVSGDPEPMSSFRSRRRASLTKMGSTLKSIDTLSGSMASMKAYCGVEPPAHSVLAGYDADGVQPKLRYGDCISLVPNGVNGVLAHSQHKGWVEMLSSEVCVPPNVRDCRIRIIPRMHHTESKLVKKLLKAGVWDDGKRLEAPQLPEGQIPRCRDRVQWDGLRLMLFCTGDSCSFVLEGQAIEFKRFGDYVQLQHNASNRMITISKSRSIQRGGHLIEFDSMGGGEASVFEIQPAYRIISQGELVSSGDLVVFVSMKKFEGGKCYLDIATNDEGRARDQLGRVRRKSMDLGGSNTSGGAPITTRQDVLESLRCDSPYIISGEEIIASLNPTFWRALQFSSHDSQSLSEFCGDCHVGLYHKDAESYLCFDPAISSKPLLVSSSRVSVKARKKASWIWKIEYSTLLGAGQPIECGDRGNGGYRVMHLATRMYLCADGGELRMSERYSSDDTLFTFKSLARALWEESTSDRILTHSLVYLRSKSEGGWLTQGKKLERNVMTPQTPLLSGGFLGSRQEHSLIVASLKGQGKPSERDALRFLPVRDIDVNAITEMRHLKQKITNFRQHLELLPDCQEGQDQGYSDGSKGQCISPDGSSDGEDQQGADVSKRATVRLTFDTHMTDDDMDEDIPLPEGTQRVLDVIEKCGQDVTAAVTHLLLQVTVDDDPDPLTRDGNPNVFVQKLIRELMMLQDLVALIEVSLRKGLVTELLLMDERMSCARELMSLVFRLLKQSVKGSEKNGSLLLHHVKTFALFLGKGIAAMEVITEIYKGNREMLSQIEGHEVSQYIQQMHHDGGHITTSSVRCAMFLSSMCGCGGQPISKNQDQICRMLFDPARVSCLPRLRVSLERDKTSKGDNMNSGHSPMAALAAMAAPSPQVRRKKGFIDAAAIMMMDEDQHTMVAKLYADLVDKDGQKLVSLDFSEYLEHEQSGDVQVERCEHVLGQRLGRLEEKDLLMVYIVRCIELFCELALGRNHSSLSMILRNKNFSLDYSQILLIMFSKMVPISIRALYVKLMQRLYLDRDPQCTKPEILFTRAWKKVVTSHGGVHARSEMFRRDAREQMLTTKKLGNTEVLPVCMTGFEDLISLVLKELPRLGTDRVLEEHVPGMAAKVTPTVMEAVRRFKGKAVPSSLIGAYGTVGQICYVRELVALINMLLDFHIIASDRAHVTCDYKVVQDITDVIFKIIDVSAEDVGAAGRRGIELGKLRIEALDVLWRTFNLRTNHRISQAVQIWEEVYEDLDQVQVMSIPGRIVSSPMTVTDVGYAKERNKLVQSLFQRFESRLATLYTDMFKSSTVFSDETGADIVPEAGAGTSPPVECLLALFCASSGNPYLSFMALKCTFRQVLQKSTALQSLRQVQLLPYEHAVRLNEETEKASKKIIGLRKHLYADKLEAYKSVIELMELLSSYITPSQTLPRSVVFKNQTILLNKEIDRPVTSLLLSLELKRSPSREAMQSDIAVNGPRREMFQAIYNFLFLLVKGNKQAQEKLSALVPVFTDHLGVQDLVVSDTIGEIYRNNPTLLSQVKSRFLARFIKLIHKYGRKARWLAIYQVFLQIEGKPFQRCQDLIVSLLIEDAELVIDLKCDYTQGTHLGKKDWRSGCNRYDLMRRNEQLLPYGSLLRYHAQCIEILGMCAAGKNPTPKALIHAFIPLRQIISNILALSKVPFSSRVNPKSPSPFTPPGSPAALLQRSRAKSSSIKKTYSSSVEGGAERTHSSQTHSSSLSASREFNSSMDGAMSSDQEFGRSSGLRGSAKNRASSIPEGVKTGTLKPEDEIDLDTLHFVKRPWVMLLTDVYLTSQEKSAIRSILNEQRFFTASDFLRANSNSTTDRRFDRVASHASGQDVSSLFARRRNRAGSSVHAASYPDCSLLEEFFKTLTLLHKRLQVVDFYPREAVADGSTLYAGHKDEYGQDLSLHLTYVHEIVRALAAIMARKDLYSTVKEKREVSSMMADIREAAQSCYPLLQRAHAVKTCRLIAELDKELGDWGVAGRELASAEGPPRPSSSNPHLKEDAFVKGWFEMGERFTSLSLGFDTFDPRELHSQSTTELAMLFGSRQVTGNFDYTALRHLLNFCNEKNADLSVKTTALRTVGAVLYMMPDSKVMTETQRKLEIQHFMRNEPPSHRGSDELRSLQTLIASIGAVNTVVSNMSGSADSQIGSPASDDVLAALRLAVSLLDGGNVAVQDMFCSVLEQPSSVNFFKMMSALLDMSLDSVKLERRRHKQLRAEADFKGGGLAQGGGGGGFGDDGEEDVGESFESGRSRGTVHFAYEIVRLIRRMCQGQHRALQDVLRRQPMNRESVDLYQETIKFLSGMEPVISSAIDRGEIVFPQAMMRSFMMLGDAMHGPNRANQKSISNTGIFDLCDRIMTKVKLTAGSIDASMNRTDSGSESETATGFSINRFATDGVKNILTNGKMLRGLLKQGKREGEKSANAKANLTRTQLKSAVLTCLLAFLEGSQRDDEVPHKMLSTLHWSIFASQMDQCYRFLGNTDDSKLEALVEQEGLQHYFLIRHLQHYDTTGSLEVHLRKFSASVSYFRERTGYIEIARNNVVERVFFQLPQICLAGKTLDKPFLEMFDARRDNADTKTRQYLHNMVRILEREQRSAGIRETSLWWTVDRSEWICNMSFKISLLINLILVLGGYAEGQSVNEFKNRVATFGSTQYDALFYYTVLPLTIRVARSLTWVFLGCCSARFFSFFWAKYPLLVLDMNNKDADKRGATAKRRGNNAGLRESGSELYDSAKKSKNKKSLFGVRTLRRMAVNPSVVYEMTFFACAVGAVLLDKPLLTVFGLFEMCFWSGSKIAIDAIRFNIHKMGQTMLLGLLVIYVWMVLGLSTLKEAHEPGTCSNMFQCLCTYIYRATRQDGVKDVLQDAIFPTNVADAIVGEGAFAWRLIWDISFWLLFVLILIAIISGIIIDAFSGMRDEQEQASEDMNNRCFVCHLDRFKLDQHAAGFEHHISTEHNPRMYLFFLLYLKTRPPEMLTGQETHVKSCVWPNMSHDWIPREATLTLKGRGDEDSEASRTKAAVVKLEGVIETMASHISKMGQALFTTNSAIEQVQDTLLQLRGDTHELSAELMQVQLRMTNGNARDYSTDQEDGSSMGSRAPVKAQRRASFSSLGSSDPAEARYV